MKAYTASLINSVSLVVLGLWGYMASDTPSMTALIPVIIGAVLLACYPGIKKENKIIAHVAVVLTLVILLGLFMPLRGAIGRGDGAAIARVAVMLITTILALYYFIKSFIEARRAREAGE
ncbi:MAG: hypothetical protein AAF587_17045 [Bacteroidota bacterium]